MYNDGFGPINKLRTWLWPLLSQIALLGVLWSSYQKYSEWFKIHSTQVIVLCLLYEFIVLLVLPAGMFFKRLWKEELERDALKATATWIRAIPAKYQPGFAKRYCKRIILEHETFNVRGLGIVGPTLEVESVLVDLKILPGQLNIHSVTDKQSANTRGIWDFIRLNQAKDNDATALVIIGSPGSGKTTLLQHIAITIASNRQRRFRVNGSTPLLLFLRQHISTIKSSPDLTLGALAEQHFADVQYHLRPPAQWFERRLNAGQCLVLLDGLDEVTNIDEREVISRWIDDQLKRYSKSRFIITSRPLGYHVAPLQRANIVEVCPFSNEQVAHFIKNWYLANEIVSNGRVYNEGVKLRANRESNDLLELLSRPQAQALGHLAVNPLLLTMLVMVHCYRGSLPGSRFDLYAEIVTVMLVRWRQAKGIQEQFGPDDKLLVLRLLAAQMMETKVREISRDMALEVVNPLLKRRGLPHIEVETFLSDLQASSGLFLDRGNGKWGFAHLAFQEYLTVAHWSSERKISPPLEILVHDAWWHEALRLYASKVDATAILQACIAANSTSTLTLAAEILEEGVHRVNGDLLYAVQEHLKNPLKSNIELVSKLLGEPLSGLQANKDILPAFTPFTVNQPPKPDPYRLAGTILAGKYLLQEHAGNGGMGVVYRATLLNSTTQVAVKILKPDLVLNHPDYVELFRREAKAARSLNHPNIVKVIDHGADSENAFIVMEWLDGLTLEEVLDRDRLDMGQIIEIFRQVCSAFEVAHLNNIIHLDVKPANIFVLSHEQPLSQIKVIDFGLAKVISNDSGTTVTRFFGTYKYCSPEHFGGKVSHRSDIYSLAVTLYHMLAGALPIGNSYINAKAHGNLDLPPIPSLRRIRPELPSAIDEMIAKALSRDPRNRPASARQLFEDFLNALGTK